MLALRHAASRSARLGARTESTLAHKDSVKFLVVGGGSAGLNVAHQVYYRFGRAGGDLAPKPGDIAIADAATYHYYQPGWTLVGGGLMQKANTRKSLASLIPKPFHLFQENVASFDPANNAVTLDSGRKVQYEYLIVAAGIKINWSAVQGLEDALADPNSGVSSIYSYEYADKTWRDIDSMRNGTAVFTQPAGVIKCAGAPQKIMWLAWDHFRRTKRAEQTQVEFWTGMPTMFSVPKYSEALNELRQQRGIRGEFTHNLVAVDPSKRKATFKKPDGDTVDTEFTILHVAPPMGPLDVIKSSPLADAAGWVDVDQGTLRHKKSEYGNVFALGDCSSLPTSKTAAAITAQTPVLVENLFKVATTGDVGTAVYDGYTSCPLLTGYDSLMLAEFKYGLEPKETFKSMLGIDQVVPRKAFFNMKKHLFPWAYWKLMTKGLWHGPRGIFPQKY
ncbi:FAD/NAD(P)-binding domain-containing protein [Exidia glandulosa HHB12029]|uniref:Sulfide:quinone oxidoreductase, mitochondrial n=1 Tax=Exidia glandulosa HHB12029 TaxID=1314781 RepID=A0A165GVI7_EXIGL|nr:FAD/NAD(P)-binding domain-containing protein [Exidia glandulosa HHB12029]